eukprot:8130-Heterococcus_DN1.PRE.1
MSRRKSGPGHKWLCFSRLYLASESSGSLCMRGFCYSTAVPCVAAQLVYNHSTAHILSSTPFAVLANVATTSSRIASLLSFSFVLCGVTPKGQTSTGGSARPVTSTLGLSKLSGPTQV